MNIRKLQNSSLSLLFNVEGTDYSINLSKECGGTDDDTAKHDDDINNKKEEKFKVKLTAGHRSVLIEKVLNGEDAPEYKVEGEGMEKDEMVTFGQNWMVMVCGSLDYFGMLQGSVDMKTMGLESFYNIFNHFFGERLEELMIEEEMDDMEEEMEIEG